MTLLAIDDGLTSGNLNWADIFFLIGAILAVLGAVAAKVAAPPYQWAVHALGFLGVGLIGFGLFLL